MHAADRGAGDNVESVQRIEAIAPCVRPQAARITVAVAFNDAQSSALTADPCLIRDFEPPAPLGWGFSQVTKDLQMKGFIAACIAVGILWGVDVEVNDGRYSAVVKNAITSILPR